MSPTMRMRYNRWYWIVETFGLISLTLGLLFMVGFAVFLIITPALPVMVSLIDKPISTPHQAGAVPRVYRGDDMKGQPKK